MKKAIGLAALLFFAPFLASGQSLTSMDNAVAECARYLQGRFPKGTRAALVAVSSENQELGEYVLGKLSADNLQELEQLHFVNNSPYGFVNKSRRDIKTAKECL